MGDETVDPSRLPCVLAPDPLQRCQRIRFYSFLLVMIPVVPGGGGGG